MLLKWPFEAEVIFPSDGEIFLLLEKNTSYFTTSSVEKQAFVFFVAAGVRFFCV